MCSEKIKDINIKVFNMITNKNEAKTIKKHILCDCKCKFNNTTCNSNQNWDNKTCQCECKNIVHAKKVIVGILAFGILHVFVRIASI